jgi:hypothetical protein
VAQINNVHPGQGQVDDKIAIDLQYDPTPGGKVPNVVHVVFHDNVDAPEFNVTAMDSANRTLTVVARVPGDAVTGPIQVDLDTFPPISTVQNFTVRGQKPGPMTVTQIAPPMGQGYQRGTRLVITLSGHQISQRAQVYFPRSDYGPANLQVPGAQFTSYPARCTVNAIPRQAANRGRVRIADGPVAVYTRVLTFV